MKHIPREKPGYCPILKGNTKNCKWTHLVLTRDNLRPGAHCFHAGPEKEDPFGNIKCSDDDCEGKFCFTITHAVVYRIMDWGLLSFLFQLNVHYYGLYYFRSRPEYGNYAFYSYWMYDLLFCIGVLIHSR